MADKMLIDASHPEETRVVVVRGNRIEEFDFESQHKKQLRGNIYLAKVTRVEPSLQAAFVDYGGNRHGFLAFSEIHPDYYQIPLADRQALLEAEAEDAREDADMENGDDEPTSGDDDRRQDSEPEAEASEKKSKPRTRRSRGRGRSKKTDLEAQAEIEGNTGDESPSDDQSVMESNAAPPSTDEPAETATPDVGEVKEAGDRSETQSDEVLDTKAEEFPEESNSGDNDDETPPTTIAAMVEGDEISEEIEPQSDESNSREGPDGEAPAEVAADAKPEKKKRVRKPRKTAAQKAEEAAAKAAAEAEEGAASPEGEEIQSSDAPQAEQADITDVDTPSDQVLVETDTAEEVEPEKPKRKSTRGRRAKAAPQPEPTNEDDDNVESVGSEDALEEVPERERRRPRKQYRIQEVIKRRQILLVQVVKEERGNKGAALTTYLSLAGRYSVLMPNTARGGGISRKITNVQDRKRLKEVARGLDVPQGMGVILRTAGANRTKAEIKRDFEYLMRLWENVRTLTLNSTAPCLVYEEGSLIKRSIRDLYNKDIDEVIVSGEDGYREAKDFMKMLMPSHAKVVQPYRDIHPIFTRSGIEAQLDRMLQPQVTLKSGGYIIINQTEALVAIDVNSGRSTKEHSIEDTALQTNLEACDEVARQLRLRDLAGLIVIDYIDMEEKRNNRAVEKRLKDCLKNDRARIQVGRISHFGLMEMSRQRIRASVLESTMQVCDACGGAGHVRSQSSVGLLVLRGVEEYLLKHTTHNIIVHCSPATALYVLNQKRDTIVDLESRFGVNIQVEADGHDNGQHFTVERGERVDNPVDIGQMAPIDFDYGIDDGDDNSPVVDAAQDERDDEQPRRKRRRRRRGGRNNSNEEQRADDVQSADDDVQSADDDSGDDSADRVRNARSGDDEEDGERKRKRRRRGKRGGRRNRGNDDDTAASEASEELEQSAESVADNADLSPADDDTVSAEAEKTEVDSADSKIEIVPEDTAEASDSEMIEAEEPGPEEVAGDETAAQDVEIADAANTEAATAIESTPAETETSATEGSDGEKRRAPRSTAALATSEPVVTSTTVDTEEVEGKGRKKGGWWQRRGFF